MIDSGTGSLGPSLDLYILSGIEHQLNKELDWQNQLIYLQIAAANEDYDDMREIKQLSSSLKGMMDDIKQTAAAAQAAFQTEAERAKTNAGKVISVAADLKASNQELEAFLGESDSNFPPTEIPPPEKSSGASPNTGTGEAVTPPTPGEVQTAQGPAPYTGPRPVGHEGVAGIFPRGKGRWS